MKAFAKALESDEIGVHEPLEASSPGLHAGSPVTSSPRVRKVSALSDFAPVNLKVKRCVLHLLPGCLSRPHLYLGAEGEGRPHMTGDEIGSLPSSGGHCWYGSIVRVLKRKLTMLTVLYIPIHLGGILVVCYNTATC